MFPAVLQLVRDSLAACDRVAGLKAAAALGRELERFTVETIAAMEREDSLKDLKYTRVELLLMDVARIDYADARRIVVAAREAMPRVGVTGDPLPALLPDTAAAYAADAITTRHVDVIAQLLGSRAALRLTTSVRVGAEIQLAAQARTCTPQELRRWGRELIDLLDQDGAEPDDTPPAPNELHLRPSRDGRGGSIRGQLDSITFERVQTILGAKTCPASRDDDRTLAERQADALNEVCGHVLDHSRGVLPDVGGQRPQVVVTVPLAELQAHARRAMLEYGSTLCPSELRLLACDCAVVRVVMDGNGQPLDVGRATRVISPAIRRAVIARDRGCAHPGCDCPASWVEVHHIVGWEHGGPTRLDNLVALCKQHHRQVHATAWIIRIAADGLPEFIPPKWLDADQTPRRKPKPPTLEPRTPG